MHLQHKNNWDTIKPKLQLAHHGLRVVWKNWLDLYNYSWDFMSRVRFMILWYSTSPNTMRWSSVLTICRLSISEPQHATLLCANELYAGGFTECLLLKISKGFERNNSRGNQSTAQIQQVKLPKSDPFGSDSFTLTYHYSQLHPPKKHQFGGCSCGLSCFAQKGQKGQNRSDLCLEFHREAK